MRQWSEQEDELIADAYQNMQARGRPKELAQMLGVNPTTIRDRAIKLGVYQDLKKRWSEIKPKKKKVPKSAAVRKKPLYKLYPSEHNCWNNIKKRCLRTWHPQYAEYGGRGIGMYKDWQSSFEAFLSYVGPKPHAGLSLDRIDNDKGYEPGNVRWATYREQNYNRRPMQRRAQAAPIAMLWHF